jgi:hypothetical protein
LGYNYIAWLYKLYKDRDWSEDEAKTKAVLQTEYEAINTGPELLYEVRLSQILCSFFVTMTFSAGIPLLYLALFLEIVIIYWFDKFWCKKRASHPVTIPLYSPYGDQDPT